MTWRAKQGPATFRGVRFYVDSAETSGGRHTVAHSRPGSEKPPHVEDLGLLGKTFPVEGYVLGDDYEAQRDELMRALDTPGPGELVHPYFGTRHVQAKAYRIRQERQSGGRAQFSITFEETSNDAVTPTVSVDAAGAATQTVTSLRSAAVSLFITAHTQGTPGALLTSLPASELAAVTSALGAMNSIVRSVVMPPEVVARFMELSKLTAPVGEFETGAEQLAVQFGVLFDELLEGGAPASAFLRLFAFDPGERPPATTPARVEERQDFDATVLLLQRYALAAASTAVVAATFTSYDEAVAARDEVTAAVDRHVEATSDDAYSALDELRASLVIAVPGEDSDLPHLQRVAFTSATPSLVISQRLYGALDREADLVARNSIQHPGFVSGELEVLSV